MYGPADVTWTLSSLSRVVGERREGEREGERGGREMKELRRVMEEMGMEVVKGEGEGEGEGEGVYGVLRAKRSYGTEAIAIVAPHSFSSPSYSSSSSSSSNLFFSLFLVFFIIRIESEILAAECNCW